MQSASVNSQVSFQESQITKKSHVPCSSADMINRVTQLLVAEMSSLTMSTADDDLVGVHTTNDDCIITTTGKQY